MSKAVLGMEGSGCNKRTIGLGDSIRTIQEQNCNQKPLPLP
jgi:hypothetical protein